MFKMRLIVLVSVFFCSNLLQAMPTYTPKKSAPECNATLNFCTYYIANQGVDAHTLKRKAEVLLNSIGMVIPIEFIIDRNIITYSHPDASIRDKVALIFQQFDRYSPLPPVTDIFLYLDIYAVKSNHVKDYNFNLFKIGRGSSSYSKDATLGTSITSLLFNGWDWQFQMDYSNVNGWYRAHERYLVATEQGGSLREIKVRTVSKVIGTTISIMKGEAGIKLSGSIYINPSDPTNVQIEDFSITHSVEDESEYSSVQKYILPPKSWNLWHNTSRILHQSEINIKAFSEGTQFIGIKGGDQDTTVKLIVAVTPFIGSNVLDKDEVDYFKFRPDELEQRPKSQMGDDLEAIFHPNAIEHGVEKGSISDMFGLRPFIQLITPPTTNTAYKDIVFEISNSAMEKTQTKSYKLQHLMKHPYTLPPINPEGLKDGLSSEYIVKVYLKTKWLDKGYNGVIGAQYNFEYNPTYGENTLTLRDHKYLTKQPKKKSSFWGSSNNDNDSEETCDTPFDCGPLSGD